MKLTAALIIALAMLPLPAAAQTMGTSPPPSSTSNPPPPPPMACPPGTHWEEAGYIGHSKYRPARCARDDGKE